MADEYSELNENMRFYGDMRFKQLTLFFVITGALLGVQFGKAVPADLNRLIPGIGLLTVLVFWIMERSAANYYWDFRRRVWELEATLSFKQFSLLRPRKLSATRALHIPFIGFLIMWVIVFVHEL